jgi:hypothetical protein
MKNESAQTKLRAILDADSLAVINTNLRLQAGIKQDEIAR